MSKHRPGGVERFTNGQGEEVVVDTDEKYILYRAGDTGLVIDKTLGEYRKLEFATTEEREEALGSIAGDHPVYDRDDPDFVQLNPAAANYKRRS